MAAPTKRLSLVSRAKTQRVRTRGVALIEVMIALLLFAIGILGIVGLQASMKQVQTDAKVRADAANLVDELAAVMWADLGNGGNLNKLVDYSAGSCGGNARCGAWLTKLGNALPQGALETLELDPATDTMDENFGKVKVKVSWTMPSGGAHHFSTTFNIAPKGI
jgi:type IV pilus assembly protein PilV